MSNGSWRVDETCMKVKGRWTCLYRAVDKGGQTIDFLLPARRDASAKIRCPHRQPWQQNLLFRLLDRRRDSLGRMAGPDIE